MPFKIYLASVDKTRWVPFHKYILKMITDALFFICIITIDKLCLCQS